MLTPFEENAILNCRDELLELIRELCAIPAPSNHEELRATFCRDRFLRWGFENVTIDTARNVICSWNDDGVRPVTVIMAHTDTVFPDTEPMPLIERDGKMFCPGITDDTAQLAAVMICARILRDSGFTPENAMLFVANSGEEGLGNLHGSREIVRTYGSRITAFVSFDGRPEGITNRAVGSHRCRVSVKTAGGHSFGNFGNPNAIVQLSEIIGRLYEAQPPKAEGSITTWNVGTISGGTSVNTIAQNAEMLYEYRSNNADAMAAMERFFENTIREFRGRNWDIETERVGDRPCSPAVIPEGQNAIDAAAAEIVRSVTGAEPVFHAGSTDANIPLSLGIPAVTMGACRGGGAHTREEWLDPESLVTGCRVVLETMKRFSHPLEIL